MPVSQKQTLSLLPLPKKGGCTFYFTYFSHIGYNATQKIY